MITLGLGLLTAELANSMGWLTGGTDGLSGVDVWPIFDHFEFDLWGYTAYAYALAVLFVGVLVSRRIVHSSFGLSLRGIRENLARMPAIGSPYRRRLQVIYVISAGLAGIAGALLTQTTETVSLDTLSFQRSADVVVMLILGGTGRLYGGIVGAIIFMVARDQLSDMNPQYWYFWIGILLIVVVLAMPGGILGALARLVGRRARDERRRRPRCARSSYGRISARSSVARDISLTLPRGARHALIGPNGAGKTTLVNLITGTASPRFGAHPARRRRRHPPADGGPRQGRAGPHLPDQRAVSRPHPDRGADAGGVRAGGRSRPVLARAGLACATRSTRPSPSSASSAWPTSPRARRARWPMASSGCLEIALALATRPSVLLLDEPAAGVPKSESAELFRVIAALPDDISVLFIEHDMSLVFKFASRIVVLVAGGVLLEAEPDVIRTDPRVREVYLGQAHHG